MNFRVGIGYDVHVLKEGLPLFLGGIKIPHSHGLVGHSDADVLIHAVCDALLGALALGDIGQHFPDTSDEYKGIDSKILLKKTCDLIQAEGFSLINLDSTLMLEQPKLRPYIKEIQKSLADILGVRARDVSVKATTTEKLGFTGREEGIAAEAIVLLRGQ